MSFLGISDLTGDATSLAGDTWPETAQPASLSGLPCMPQVLLVLLEKCNEWSANQSELVQLVRLDPGLSARVLTYATPPAQAAVPDVAMTMQSMGMKVFRHLVSQAAFQQSFSATEPADDKALLEFWRHALSSAMMAKRLAEIAGYRDIQQAWLAGLLHDLGRLSLNNLDIETRDISGLLQIESEQFSTTHPARGADLLAALRDSSFLPDAVRYHHTELSLLREAHLLVRICSAAQLMVQSDAMVPASQLDEISEMLGIQQQSLAGLTEQNEEVLNSLLKQCDIALSEQSVAEAREKLCIRVKRQALMYGQLSPLQGVTDTGLKTRWILQAARNLFQVRSAMLFRLDSDEHFYGLAAHACNEHMVQQLSLAGQGNSNLLARCLSRGEIVSGRCHDEDARQSIVDNQVLSLLNTSHFLFLPLSSHDDVKGVLLAGVDETFLPDILLQSDLLNVFSEQVGAVLAGLESETALGSGRNSKDIQAEARKLVHEVSNPLSVVMNYLAVLSAKIGNSHIAREDVRIITEEIERVNDIVRDFASDTPRRESRVVDINAAIQDMVRAMKEGLQGGDRVSIKLDLDTSIGNIATSKDGLKQVLSNMLRNAIEAVQPDGSIKLRTRGQVRMDNQDYAEIAIIDNGPGIPDSVYSHLFQPVKSTKGKAHSGLGLSIVYRLVSEMGGKISCRTTKGKGTVFHILIPINPVKTS